MYTDTLNGSEKSGELPDAVGPTVQLQEKLYVPVKEHPDVRLCVALVTSSPRTNNNSFPVSPSVLLCFKVYDSVDSS